MASPSRDLITPRDELRRRELATLCEVRGLSKAELTEIIDIIDAQAEEARENWIWEARARYWDEL